MGEFKLKGKKLNLSLLLLVSCPPSILKLNAIFIITYNQFRFSLAKTISYDL